MVVPAVQGSPHDRLRYVPEGFAQRGVDASVADLVARFPKLGRVHTRVISGIQREPPRMHRHDAHHAELGAVKFRQLDGEVERPPGLLAAVVR